MTYRDDDLNQREDSGVPRRDDVSGDPDVRDRELQELESGRGAGGEDLNTGDDLGSDVDTPDKGEGAETTE